MNEDTKCGDKNGWIYLNNSQSYPWGKQVVDPCKLRTGEMFLLIYTWKTSCGSMQIRKIGCGFISDRNNGGTLICWYTKIHKKTSCGFMQTSGYEFCTDKSCESKQNSCLWGVLLLIYHEKHALHQCKLHGPRFSRESVFVDIHGKQVEDPSHTQSWRILINQQNIILTTQKQ